MKRPLTIFLRIVAVLLVLIVAGFAFLYIRFKPDEQGRIIPWGESIDTSVLPEIRASLNGQKGLVILEGLPHQGWERDLLESEIASKETTKIHGFHFYSKALKPSADDLETLVSAITSESGIVEWEGMKLCGGYHPDYAVRWYDSKGKMFEALICFGCHEIKLYGDGLQLYADLNKETYVALKETLGSYGDQRPKANNNGNKRVLSTGYPLRVENVMTISQPQR